MVTGNSKGVKESMKLNWNFQRCGGGGGREVQIEIPSVGNGRGVVFSATKQCKHALSDPNSPKASVISYNYMYTAIQTT